MCTLCDPQCSQDIGHSHQPLKGPSCPFAISPHLHPQPQRLSFCPLPRMSYKFNNTVHPLLCLASFIQHNGLEIYPCRCTHQQFIPSSCRVEFHCTDIPQCVYTAFYFYVNLGRKGIRAMSMLPVQEQATLLHFLIQILLLCLQSSFIVFFRWPMLFSC